MTIQEAIQSGKPFKRKGSNNWMEVVNCSYFQSKIADLLATDWEVKPELCKHEPDSIFYNYTGQTYECKLCGVELIAEWKAK